MIPSRALILSAGRGERLRPLTDDRPKTMVLVGGRPVLEYHIVLLRELGIRDIAINLHHRPEVVRNHFGDGSAWEVRLTYSVEEELLGTAGAVKRFEPYFADEPFLVIYGDNLFDYDLRPLLNFHARSDAIATLGVFRGPNPRAGGIVGLDPSGRVWGFLEKPRQDEIFSDLVSAGIYVMEPGIFDFIPESGASDFGRDVLPRIVQSELPVYGLEMEGYLTGLDTPEMYERAQAEVAQGKLRHPLTTSREAPSSR